MEMEPKRQRPPFFKSVRNYFREYCNCSSIHGFRYFGEKRTHFERGWWFVVFSITLVACVIAIREVYQKWKSSPVIVSFATRETPIYKIPFPAVTICPEAKSKQALFNHTDIVKKLMEGKNLTAREQKLYDYMGLICKENFKDAFSHRNAMDGEDFFKELVNINYINTFDYSSCSYMGKNYNCSKLFKPIITDEGICFTFNMLDRSEIYKQNVYCFIAVLSSVHYGNFHVMDNLTYNNWSMDDGYSDDAGVYPYPQRALLAGAKNSLTINLMTSKSYMDHTCKESIQGFRVLLHTPMRIPSLGAQYFTVPLNQVVLGIIQPVMITTSESVMLYNPRRRECYFPSEKQLKFFKIYTSLNCKLECLANFTRRFCGCVNFFMPRENTTRICGVSMLPCMKRAEDLLQIANLHKKIKLPNTGEEKFYHDLPDCDCMPICTDLSYDVETSQNDWNWLSFLQNFAPGQTIPEDEYYFSRLILFFKSSQFITSQRHELYGPTDFLANFGGLLGLFTGFSVLSLMEAIYFLTVRLCCNSRLYGYWAGPEI